MSKSTYPKATFKWDLDTETERILQASVNTANGFYLSKGFYVLDKRTNQDSACIYLPNFNPTQYASYWDEIKKAPTQIPVKISKELYEFVKTSIPAIVKIDNKQKAKFEKDWKKIEKDFWKALSFIFPECTTLISELEVRITSFGSVSSYSYLIQPKNNKLITYLREDFEIGQLAEVIITSIYHHSEHNSPVGWEYAESVTDFILQKTNLRNLFPKYVPTLCNLSFGSLKIKQSKLYLSDLGVPEIAKPTIKNGQLFLNNQNIEEQFTKSQANILKLLINNKNIAVFYDDIADLIWGQNSADKYSIWAISKHMNRLRDRMIKLGVTTSDIHAVRGRGYLYEETEE